MNLDTIKQQLLRGRYYPLLWLSAIYVVISTVTRLVLFFLHLKELDSSAGAFFTVMPVGFLYDLVTCLYLFAFYALYLLIVPQRVYRTRVHRAALVVASMFAVYGLLYLGIVEYFFFDEFDARFNFVAVGYLIYPHEVFVNIWQSYPVGRALIAVFVVTLAVYWWRRGPLQESLRVEARLHDRWQPFVAVTALLVVAYTVVDVNTGRVSENRVVNELAQNGIYSFFYAAFHSALDYNQYYATLPEDEAAVRLRRLVGQPNATFLPDAPNPIARHVDNGPERPNKLNVVLLVEESLGADFVGAYGAHRGLTPNIDRLATDSILFTNVYATGTRTVRGLEAISCSFPPIPGESILKRPGKNEGIFTWGEVMRKNGYTPTFLYGGYGTFDSMNYFFANNGFSVIDRSNIDNPRFTNIWGVSDEDLLHHAIKVFDAQHANGEKIFALIMSTSNHKPFTYPAGIPGVRPEGGGRLAGVRYADYAIGRFFEEIRQKPYFDDTVFVIVGDHGARVYGKVDIPLRTYELPLLMYAPKHFKPRRVDTLVSQIDIAPTVLGLLNISYDSVFFGQDVFRTNPGDKYALLSHNRDVALLGHDELNQLGIQKAMATFRYDRRADVQSRVGNDEDLIRDAISVYQEGYNLFMRGLYKLN